jgi:hypothetical protein
VSLLLSLQSPSPLPLLLSLLSMPSLPPLTPAAPRHFFNLYELKRIFTFGLINF